MNFATHGFRTAAIFVILSWLSVGSSTVASAAPSYTGIDLYTVTPPSGLNSYTIGTAIGFVGQIGSVSNGGQVIGQALTPSGDAHAIVASIPGVSVDLHPSQFGVAQSRTLSTNGSQQVGFLGDGSQFTDHAMLWNGTAASAVDLHPTQFTGQASYALGTDGIHQVGADLAPSTHAMLWSGTAASAVDLNPIGYNSSVAIAVSGNNQVGLAGQPTPHAFLWHGTAASGVDLHPTILDNNNQPLFANSRALGVSASQQVGYGSLAANLGTTHAILWTGTAASAVDLNPTILGAHAYSIAFGTNGTQQVGMAAGDDTAQNLRAIVWQGTAASAIDLQQYLPPVFSFSAAYAIDSQGIIYGLGFRTNGTIDAVEWTPVPEPATWFILLLSSPAIFLRRRKPSSR